MPYLNKYILDKVTKAPLCLYLSLLNPTVSSHPCLFLLQVIEGSFVKENVDELCWTLTAKKNYQTDKTSSTVLPEKDAFRLWCLFNFLSEDKYPLVMVPDEVGFITIQVFWHHNINTCHVVYFLNYMRHNSQKNQKKITCIFKFEVTSDIQISIDLSKGNLMPCCMLFFPPIMEHATVLMQRCRLLSLLQVLARFPVVCFALWLSQKKTYILKGKAVLQHNTASICPSAGFPGAMSTTTYCFCEFCAIECI